MKNHILTLAGLSGLLVLLGGCGTPASSPPAQKGPAPQEAVQIQASAPSRSLEYQMAPADFEKRFGIARSGMARAPKPRLAPVPPLPWNMFEAQRGGWIDFVVEIDIHARVSKVEVVGYSEPNVVVPASADTIRKWWFFDGTKPGPYLLRATFTLVGPNQADVTFN
jgi:hypothetical protein